MKSYPFFKRSHPEARLPVFDRQLGAVACGDDYFPLNTSLARDFVCAGSKYSAVHDPSSSR